MNKIRYEVYDEVFDYVDSEYPTRQEAENRVKELLKPYIGAKNPSLYATIAILPLKDDVELNIQAYLESYIGDYITDIVNEYQNTFEISTLRRMFIKACEEIINGHFESYFENLVEEKED